LKIFDTSHYRVFGTRFAQGLSVTPKATDLPETERPAASEIRGLSAVAPSDYALGSWIDGKLELLARLGQGSAAALWVAHHHALDVDVVVKLTSDDWGSSSAARDLLLEARSGARISHSALRRILDFGITKSSDPYIVMEYLEGQSLSRMLERDCLLDAIQAVSVLLPVVHALSLAHKNSLFYGGHLKLESIFISRTEDGRVQPKLLLERAWQTASGEEPADIHSLCFVLYELLTSDKAPTAEKLQAISERALAAIIERGLETVGEERWRSMNDLGHALADWLTTRGVHEDVTGMSLRASWPAVVGQTSTYNEPQRPLSEPSLIAPSEAPEPNVLKSSSAAIPAAIRSRWLAWGVIMDPRGRSAE